MQDGTILWLQPSSVLYVSSDYGHATRRIRLKGEAYFDIASDAQRPFSVELDGVVTQVLGTSFAAEAWPFESEVRISLLTGKIAVQSVTDTLLLTPGETVAWGKSTMELTRLKTVDNDPSAWTRGSIVLNQVPLTEALDRLGRMYGKVIYYDEKKLKGKRIAGEFEKQDLAGILNAVLFVHHLQYSISNNGTYTIY